MANQIPIFLKAYILFKSNLKYYISNRVTKINNEKLNIFLLKLKFSENLISTIFKVIISVK